MSSTAIRVTLTMNPDTARSVLSILEHALREGDERIARQEGEFDQHAIDFHNSTKQSLERQVIDPIRDCFPPNVWGPADLVGWKVDFSCEPLAKDGPIRGLVTAVDKDNPLHVLVTSGMSEFSVHWGNCRVVV